MQPDGLGAGSRDPVSARWGIRRFAIPVHLVWAPDDGEPWVRRFVATGADYRRLSPPVLVPPGELVVGVGAEP
ncbi:MAG: hypothetical protein RLZZ127_539 [Planctomycetota bacterium]|jgi:hypothetical protein